MVLASHNYEIGNASSEDSNKKRKGSSVKQTGLSQLVLIVNNWSFVRDYQHHSKVRECQLSDFQVQLKISSSAFKNRQSPSIDFHFDKNAANFPYDSFVQIMRSGLTKSFIADVRQMYEETEPPITVEEELPAPIAVEKPTDCVLIPSAHVPLKKKKKNEDDDTNTVGSASGAVSSESEEEEDEDEQWRLVTEGPPPPAALIKPKPKRGKKK